VSLTIVAACGDPGEPPTPTQVEIVAGTHASATVATTLGDSLVARVLDQQGRSMAGVVVSWAVTVGGGHVNPASDSTDANGEARTRWTLGPTAGAQAASASVGGITPATFSATAVAGAVAGLVKDQGDGQLAVVGTAAALPLVARAEDAHGNPVAGAAVTWAVTVGGGSVNPASSTTDAGGNAATTFTAGTIAGGKAVTASTGGVSTAFSVTGTAGPATALVVVDGDDQTSVLDSPLPDSLVVRAADQYGNGVPGVTVTWTANGGGSVSPASTTTRANGETKTQRTLGSSIGASATSATAAGLAPVIFTASGVATAQNLTVGGFYLTQSTQTLTRSVPLVEGRAGYLRVWVVAALAENIEPKVRVRWYLGSALIRTDTLNAPGAQVHTSIAQTPLSRSWNLPVPGALIQPGLEIELDADPDGLVPEIDESDNAFPGGRIALDVRSVSPLSIVLVPVRQSSNNLIGNVTVGNQDAFLVTTRKIFPIATITSSVRATYTSTTPALDANDDNDSWSTILSELNALRVSAGGGSHYYGVVRVTYNSGVAGVGYLGVRTAMGWDYLPSGDPVMAHELGHNFNRRHAPCGGPGGVDGNYPYAGGRIGVFGLDVGPEVLKDTTVFSDIMGYCSAQWISDYTYNNVLTYRTANPLVTSAGAVAQRSLLIWGRIDDGRLVLEPAFQVVTPPVLPTQAGPYSVTGVDATGATVFSFSFSGEEVADLPNRRSFAFAIPAAAAGVERLVALRLTDGARTVELRSTEPAAGQTIEPQAVLREVGPDAVRLEWSASAAPMAMVRDVRTGEILSFARAGVVEIPTRARELDVTFSDGVRGTTRRVTVAR
jgi:hypothetical protein